MAMRAFHMLSAAVWAAVGVAFPRAETVILPAAAQAAPTVSSSVVTVNNRRYAVWDYDDPAAKKFRVFSVLGTDAQGTVRTSDPVMVIVRAP